MMLIESAALLKRSARLHGNHDRDGVSASSSRGAEHIRRVDAAPEMSEHSRRWDPLRNGVRAKPYTCMPAATTACTGSRSCSTPGAGGRGVAVSRPEIFRASADAYDRFIGRYGAELATALLDFAGIEPGMRALDVGCGPGALAAVLAERLGAANVSAADPSPPFVDACATRLPGVDVLEADAEALPFADGAFDAALSQLVVNFMRDSEAGVREAARVTRPGGIVAACVWDYRSGMTLLRAFWDAAREVDPKRGAAADEGVVMRWCAEGELAELWGAAGLESVRVGSLVASARYANFEDLWSPLPTGVGPAGAFCESLEEDDRAALHDGFHARLGVGDSPFTLTARAWSVVGRTSS